MIMATEIVIGQGVQALDELGQWCKARVVDEVGEKPWSAIKYKQNQCHITHRHITVPVVNHGISNRDNGIGDTIVYN